MIGAGLDLPIPASAPTSPPAQDDSNRDGIPPADGVSAAIDGAPGQSRYGENNISLPDDLQKALLDLKASFEKEQAAKRIQVLRKRMRARFYWNAEQYLNWNDQIGSYQLRADANDNVRDGADQTSGAENEGPTTRNIIRPHGKSICAALSAQKPETKAWPTDASKPEDVETAEAAANVIELFERNNKIRFRQLEQTYLFWTDGMTAGYVRYRVDGARFGFKEAPILAQQEVELMAAGFRCANPACPSPTNPADTMAGVCAGCGTPLEGADGAEMTPPVPPAAFQPAISGTTSVQTGTKKIPDGQDTIDLCGHLEVEVPYYASEQSEFPFLFYKGEFHKSLLKQTYSNVADKIGVGSTDASEELERLARLWPRQGTGAGAAIDEHRNLVTLSRCWFRPWAFQSIETKATRDQLTALFPSGCYVAFAGNVYCESRDESMDDHWVVKHAEPGTGQDRGGMGDDLLPLQDEKNMLANYCLDAIEHGIPWEGINEEFFGKKAMAELAVPGAKMPFKMPQGRSTADAVIRGEATKIPSEIINIEQGLTAEAEFISGDYAALQGASEENINTASGYQFAANQAKGRLTIPWIAISDFWAEVAQIAFDLFRKRGDSAQISILGDDGEWKSKLISAANLRGNAVVRVEPDSEFPMTWLERSSNFKSLLTQAPGNPAIMALLSDPANLDAGKRYMGLDDITVPGADDRRAELRAIDAMESGMDLPVNPSLENSMIRLTVMKEFYASADGFKRLMANPEFMVRFQMRAEQHQMAMMPPPMPAGPGAAPGAGPGGPGLPLPDAPPMAPPAPN